MRDDLGAECVLPPVPTRVVSLVPSLTEAIAASAPGVLVGATDWCTHPPGLDVVRVRGTKNPHLERIVSLRPDLVVANEEENRKRDVEALRDNGIPVWVTDVRSVDGALTSLERLLDLLAGAGARVAGRGTGGLVRSGARAGIPGRRPDLAAALDVPRQRHVCR